MGHNVKKEALIRLFTYSSCIGNKTSTNLPYNLYCFYVNKSKEAIL